MRLTAVSLFAGVGGFDLALQRSGVDVAAAVEIDPAARGVLTTQDPISGPVAPALGVSTNGGGVLTITGARRITPTECERLQGFPDGWTATSNGKRQADSARYRQMGNAVAVPVVEWITRRIVAAEASTEMTAVA